MNPLLPHLTFLLIPLLLPSTGCAQASKKTQKIDPRLAVSYRGGGVTWQDFHLEIARRYRGRDFAKKGMTHLIETRIVAIESRKRGIEADKLAVEAQIQQVRQGLASRKKKWEDFLQERHLTPESFREVVKLSLNTGVLVRKDLGLEGEARPSEHKIQLWMSEKMKELGVVTDVTKLPPDVCLRIQGREIPLFRLGESMARILAPQDKKRILREMAAYRLLQEKARELGIQIEEGDLERQLEQRREEFAKRPQFAKQGVKLEDLLHAQGRTLADLTQGEVFRTNLLIQRIGDRLYPMEQIRAEYQKDPAYWRDRLGPSRRTFRLWIQGPPRRTRADAEVYLAELAKKIQSQQSFQAMAREYSEDLASKKLAGDLGFLFRLHARYPEKLTKAAFDCPCGVFSPKVIEESGGFSLLMVSEEKAGPQGEDLWKAIRRHKMTALLAEMIENHQLLYHLVR